MRPTNMRLLRALFAIGLFFLATGYTDCDSFSEVTVPASDTSVPIAFGQVWVNGEQEELAVGLETFKYAAEPGEKVGLVVGGMDGGGVEFVKLTGNWVLTCRDNGRDIAGYPKYGSVLDTEGQAGGVGSKVSNGVYAAAEVTVGRCPATAEVGEYVLEFRGTTVDFHDNRVQSPVYRVYWDYFSGL